MAEEIRQLMDMVEDLKVAVEKGTDVVNEKIIERIDNRELKEY
ncbi:MAG: hypothetical protein ACLFPF_06935 [Halanaerobiales bacterium]